MTVRWSLTSSGCPEFYVPSQVSKEATVKWRSACRNVTGECFRGPHLREVGQWALAVWGAELLPYAVTTEASADPGGSSGAEKVLLSGPLLG